MRLFMSYQARICDVQETVRYLKTFQKNSNLTVGIGNDSDPVSLSNPLENFACARTYRSPIGRNSRGSDQSVADSVRWQTKIFEQMRVEEMPESLVHRTPLLQDGVELFFCPALNAVQLLWARHDVALVKWSAYSLPIGKEKGVADVEEDCLGSMRHSPHSKLTRLLLLRS